MSLNIVLYEVAISLILCTSAGVDYVSTTAVITFPPGSGPGRRDCISIPIIDDFILEDDETFSVAVQSLSGARPVQDVPSRLVISPNTTLVTITDDESEEIVHAHTVSHTYTHLV